MPSAETIARGPQPVVQQLTLRALWEQYSAEAFVSLRAKTQKNYKRHWAKWELFLGKDFIAQDIRAGDVARFRAALTKQGHAVTQVHKCITDVKMVHAWGFGRELLATNRLTLYRFKTAKDERRESPGEYSDDERERLIAAVHPQKFTEWRPWAAFMIANSQGPRMNAILHLQWTDLDVELGQLVWRARWDKNGREVRQPLTFAAYSALLTAWYWRQRDRYTGPWVLYSGYYRKRALGADPKAIYHPTSLERALRNAETTAKVTHEENRGMHGFRRGIAGDIYEATGDYKLALEWIDDHDLRMATKYLKRRNPRLIRAAGVSDDRGQARPKASPKRHDLVGVGANSLADILGREDSNLQLRDKKEAHTRAPRLKSGSADTPLAGRRTAKTAKRTPRKRHQSVTRKGGPRHG